MEPRMGERPCSICIRSCTLALMINTFASLNRVPVPVTKQGRQELKKIERVNDRESVCMVSNLRGKVEERILRASMHAWHNKFNLWLKKNKRTRYCIPPWIKFILSLRLGTRTNQYPRILESVSAQIRTHPRNSAWSIRARDPTKNSAEKLVQFRIPLIFTNSLTDSNWAARKSFFFDGLYVRTCTY